MGCTVDPASTHLRNEVLHLKKAIEAKEEETTPTLVQVYQTEVDDSTVKPIRRMSDLRFLPQRQKTHDELPMLDLEPDLVFQSMEGFGAALTESCTMNLMRLSNTDRKAVLERMFSKTKGAGFDLMRIPMGASDFADASRGSYTYNDTPRNLPDPKFRHFNMDRDEHAFEIVREAKLINPDLKVIISPWSAPAWMKKPRQLHGGRLNPRHYQDFANYFVRVIREYQKRGIPVGSLTIQNEPYHETNNYPSMEMSTSEQIKFIRDFLAPTLRRESLASTRILALDHNYNLASEVRKMLDDRRMKRAVGGVAYHCYGGTYEQMRSSIERDPDVPALQTECTGLSTSVTPASDFHWWMESQSVGAVALGTTGAMGWNLCLDDKGGPRNGGCTDCRGLVTIGPTKSDSGSTSVTYNPEFNALEQVSRFIRRGSRRIGISGSAMKKVQAASFKNPDGSYTLVIQNSDPSAIRLQIRDGDCRVLVHEIPARGATSFTWGHVTKAERNTVPRND